MPLKKAGITGRAQSPKLCFVYFFLSFRNSLEDKIFCMFVILLNENNRHPLLTKEGTKGWLLNKRYFEYDGNIQ